jgi:hypothetical protein
MCDEYVDEHNEGVSGRIVDREIIATPKARLEEEVLGTKPLPPGAAPASRPKVRPLMR